MKFKYVVKKSFLLFFALSGVSIFAGCTATGPGFSGVETVKKDEALIYFYREACFPGGLKPINVYVNNKKIGAIHCKGHIKRSLKPGKYTLVAELPASTYFLEKYPRTEKAFTFLPGKTYFIETKHNLGSMQAMPSGNLVTYTGKFTVSLFERTKSEAIPSLLKTKVSE